MSHIRPFSRLAGPAGRAALLTSMPVMAMLVLSSAIAQVPPGPADEQPPAEQATESGTLAPGAWHATQLLGQTLTSSLNQSVGTVKDIVINTDGNVVAVMVGIGGFLGIGERTVPIALRHLVINAVDGDRITVSTSLSREAIEQAAALDPRESPLPSDQKP